jgi:type II secretion system protein L
VGEAQGQDRVPALVVDRARLARWLQELDAAGISLDRVLPESVFLPVTPPPALWLDGERFVLRLAPAEALAGGRDELAPLLARLPQPPQRLIRSASAHLPDSLRAMSVEELDDPFAMLGQGLAHAAGLNLLGGEFAGRRRRHGRDRNVWRWAAALAAAALGLFLLQGVLELRALQARQAQTTDAMAALYLQLVPDASRVVDAEAQLAVALDRMRGGAGSSGALPILARIAPVLGDARYSLDLIEYRDGGLELVVRGPDVAALDALREALSTQLGVAVELTSAVPGQGGVEARYRVRGAGA